MRAPLHITTLIAIFITTLITLALA
ncbi:hypothetical protein LCGC14_2013890, partial [marine sediment metagenome]